MKKLTVKAGRMAVVQPDTRKIFKITAQGDVVYVRAEDSGDALEQLRQKVGPIPANLLSLSTVSALPAGEELL